MTPYPTTCLSTRLGRVVAMSCSHEMYDNLQIIFAQTLNDLWLSNKILMTSNFFFKKKLLFPLCLRVLGDLTNTTLRCCNWDLYRSVIKCNLTWVSSLGFKLNHIRVDRIWPIQLSKSKHNLINLVKTHFDL